MLKLFVFLALKIKCAFQMQLSYLFCAVTGDTGEQMEAVVTRSSGKNLTGAAVQLSRQAFAIRKLLGELGSRLGRHEEGGAKYRSASIN